MADRRYSDPQAGRSARSSSGANFVLYGDAEPTRRLQSIAEAAGALATALARADGQPFLWIDMVDPNQRELAELAECFDLPPLAVEDATAPHHRPKYAHYNQTDFMVLQLVQVVGTPITSDAVRTPGLIDIRVSEVHAFIGASFVIAISYSQAIDLTTVRSTFERDPWFLQSPRLSTVYRIMDEVVDRYEPPLSALEDYADSLEERIFGSGPVPSQDVYYLSRELIELDVAQSPHCGVWWAHYPLPLTVTLRRRTSFVACATSRITFTLRSND